ncbi:MAG TPA: ABC transporter substrate-binding protein [Chthoniobacterales bacterium]
MTKAVTRRGLLAGAISAPFLSGTRSWAAGEPGVTSTEIKLGTTAPYSGPLSSLAIYGEAQTAFFRMINDRGGINGRKVNLLSLDNAFSPPKAVEQTRKLVEDEGVFAIAGSLGTPTNAAVQKYLNDKAVPFLFLTSGAERFNDPKNFPWVIPLYPSYVAQGAIYGRFLAQNRPDAKIAVMYENDDLGKDYLRGLKQGLGSRAAAMIVKEMPHELTDTTIDTLVVTAKSAGADTFIQFTNGKYAAQGIRRIGSINWKPLQIIASNAASIGATLVPAGLENCKGIMTVRWEKDITSPEFAKDPGVAEFKAFATKYMPRYNQEDQTAVPGYVCAWTIAEVLRRCGNELTRENLLRQATTLKDLSVPMLLPRIRLSNSPTNYDAFHAMELIQFNGERFEPRGVIEI